MQNQSAKITITVDSTGNKFKVDSTGAAFSVIRALDPYINSWLAAANSSRRPGVSDAKIAQQLLSTVARCIASEYGDSVLIPALFDLLRKYSTKRGETL